MEALELIIILVYWVLGFWAINKVWYSRHTYIVYDGGKFLIKKVTLALFLGWAAIPVAIIMVILKK